MCASTIRAMRDEVKVLRLVRERDRRGAEAPPPPPRRSRSRPIFDARGEIDAMTTVEAIESYMVGADRGDPPSGRIRRQAQALDRDRRQPARLARPRPMHRVQAWLQGRDYVMPEDVQAIAHDCLRHARSSYEASADGVSRTK